MTHIIALDLGTTGNRAVAFDFSGSIVASYYQEFTQIFPKPAWVEHDPMEIWASVQKVLGKVIEAVGIDTIQCIGITNQRETTVVWDRTTGLPVYNAIVWQCRRTADRCQALEPQRRMIQDKTGLVPDAYFSATKIEWILNQLPESTDRSNLKFGTIDTWIMDRLTNGAVHATDSSNAARTMLFNIHTMEFDRELIELFKIPPEILPQVRASNSHFGVTSQSAIGAEIPITGILGDQQASLFAQTAGEAGAIKNTYGTGLFAMIPAPIPQNRPGNLLATIGWQINNDIQYALEGSVFVGGSLIHWLRDGLGIIRNASEIEALAMEAGTSDGVVIVPAFVGLGAPYWDPTARGLMIGITRGTHRSHIAYAALEAICFQSYDVIAGLSFHAEVRPKLLRVDGGACKNNLLMQLQADTLQFPVERPKVIETTALGIAMMAGVGAKLWDASHRHTMRQVDRIFVPQQDKMEALQHWYSAVQRSRGWAE
jgi:glycerol kinase